MRENRTIAASPRCRGRSLGRIRQSQSEITKHRALRNTAERGSNGSDACVSQRHVLVVVVKEASMGSGIKHRPLDDVNPDDAIAESIRSVPEFLLLVASVADCKSVYTMTSRKGWSCFVACLSSAGRFYCHDDINERGACHEEQVLFAMDRHSHCFSDGMCHGKAASRVHPGRRSESNAPGGSDDHIAHRIRRRISPTVTPHFRIAARGKPRVSRWENVRCFSRLGLAMLAVDGKQARSAVAASIHGPHTH